MDRVLKFYDWTVGPWAGGEFLGLVLCAAAGVPKYGLPDSQEQFFRLVGRPGAVSALAREITDDGDRHCMIQEKLALLTPLQWGSVPNANEVRTVIFQVSSSFSVCNSFFF